MRSTLTYRYPKKQIKDTEGTSYFLVNPVAKKNRKEIEAPVRALIASMKSTIIVLISLCRPFLSCYHLRTDSHLEAFASFPRTRWQGYLPQQAP
jgi:hypothetical protein